MKSRAHPPAPPAAALLLLAAAAALTASTPAGAQTDKPVLHGRHWVAVTGKPLAAMAGARMFERGGNAVDAACAMLGATCTMFDDVSWGGETQALIYHPGEKRVIGINACGVAPSGATAEFFKKKELAFPPGHGPLAAVTPGNPGGLMVMLAEYGKLSLAEVLAPSIALADGYPVEADLVEKIAKPDNVEKIKQWPASRAVLLPHLGEEHEAPHPGEIFRQADLKATLEKLVAAEAEALAAGKSRKEAIYAAYERFYRGDVAEAFCRASQELGGLHTPADLAGWKVEIEEPVSTTYKGIEVYKLTSWTQGPVLLQALNILEPLDLKGMGYNSARYIHTLYQAMNLAYADRDFYYGDPYHPPAEPLVGLLSKTYAAERRELINPEKNEPDTRPGDPYPTMGQTNPFTELLEKWTNLPPPEPTKDDADEKNEGDNNDGGKDDNKDEEKEVKRGAGPTAAPGDEAAYLAAFHAGTTSIQAADKSGWAVSVTPSGGWIPACIAGETGIAMSQRMQSFVLDPAQNPFNVAAPGQRPRVTLTPSIALRDGRPFLCFSVQGGDTQDQNLLQFFLNVVEFGFDVQEACEAANITSYQMRSSFGQHEVRPGKLTLNAEVPSWVRRELKKMGYTLDDRPKTSGPITAIYFDWENGSFWGGASDYGEDTGIAW